MKENRLNAAHGIVYNIPGDAAFGCFGWPTVARTGDGTLYAGASGFRWGHVCPFGKTVLSHSTDEGKTWSEPLIVNDSLIDDRDAGVTALPGNELPVSHFTSDTRYYAATYPCAPYLPVFQSWTDGEVERYLGSFTRLRSADGQWSGRHPVKVTAPHGPIVLRDGSLFSVCYQAVPGQKKPGVLYSRWTRPEF